MNAATASVCLVFLLVVAPARGWGRKQRVTVRGRLVCASDPTKAANVRIKLVDEDTGEHFVLTMLNFIKNAGIFPH